MDRLKIDLEERKRFVDWLLSKKLMDQSIINYLFYYDKFISCKGMTKKRVNIFLKYYKNNSVAKSFINNYKTFILTHEEDFDKEILEKVRLIILPKETGGKSFKIPDYITEKQVWKIEGVCDMERDKLMLLLSFYCGLRIGGLTRVRPYSFNWEEWESSKEKIGKLKVLEKGDKERFVLALVSIMAERS